MSDTDHIQRGNRKVFELPGWGVEAFKMVCTVIVALALGYVRFSAVESKVVDHTQSITKLEAKSDSSRDKLSDVVQKVGTLEVQQALVSGEFRDSLKRIEEDVKELKTDLKNKKPIQ